MRSFKLAVFALSLLAFEASAQRAANFADSVKKFVVADQPLIIIRNARLWDGTGSQARDGQDILIKDGRISAIGPRLTATRDATTINADGKTVMPGLVMMHEHLFVPAPGGRLAFYSEPLIAQIMLAYGTTTARTAGSFAMDGDLKTKAQIAAGRLPGPDLDVTLYVDGPKPVQNLVTQVSDGQAARREVRYWHARGATSVKLFFGAPPMISRAVIDEAHRLGMTVAGHLCATFAKTAAEAGLDTLEHSMLAVYDYIPGATEGDCPTLPRQTAIFKAMATLDPQGPEVGGVLAILLKHGVAIDPTIGVRDERLCSPKLQPAPRELALLVKFEPGEGAFCPPGITAEIDERSLAFQLAAAVRYHRMGGMLVTGSDQGVVPGAMGPRELELLVRGGIAPADVLIAATRNGAIKLNRIKEIGTLEVGKRADFLIVAGKPDVAISDIRKLTHVARDGIVYDPEKLYQGGKGKLHF